MMILIIGVSSSKMKKMCVCVSPLCVSPLADTSIRCVDIIYGCTTRKASVRDAMETAVKRIYTITERLSVIAATSCCCTKLHQKEKRSVEND
ncbi:MAG: hypothetical protein M3275_04610 [Thermoproteota archaeon]|nr:hypothetical protein [Thermoproteota archaeon]